MNVSKRVCFVFVIVSVVGATTRLRATLCHSLECCGNATNSSQQCDCKVYETPLDICYNPSQLFSGDSQWGSGDFIDLCIEGNPPMINRTFYNSTNSTCSGAPDGGFSFLPTFECIGPFGKPRPWGKFECPSSIPPADV